MTKITLNNIGAGTQFQTAIASINANNDTVETAFDNTLSRDGTTPNTMNATLDMNSNRVVNLPDAIAISEPITLGQASILNGNGTITVGLPTGGTINQVLKKNSATNYDVGWGTATGTVTSVGLSLPSDFNVTGTPVTTSGTLTATFVNSPTGTGGFVRQTSPTLISPALGTPTSGVLTFCTGLPVTSVVGISPGVTTFWVTPTSANLLAAVTDETGTGSLVFGTSPILNTVDARGVWTTGTSWTLPALSLGGTVSGNANQVNNVVIGAVNPLAGTFTTLTGTNVIASTDLTSPIHKSASTITFQTNGSTTAGTVTTGQRWIIGPNTSIGSNPQFAINSNTAGSIPNTGVTNSLSLIAADEQTANIQCLAYGSSGVFIAGGFGSYRARGTAAIPVAVNANDWLMNITAGGYFTTGGPGYSNNVVMITKATDTFTSTTQGTKTEFYGVPTGTVALATAMTIQGGVTVGSTGNDPGNGHITALGGLQMYSGTAIPAGGTVGVGLKFSSTANLGIFFGSGAPTLVAGVGSLYLRTDNAGANQRVYSANSTAGGAGAWSAITSA